jgi:hypothetical protein
MVESVEASGRRGGRNVGLASLRLLMSIEA